MAIKNNEPFRTTCRACVNTKSGSITNSHATNTLLRVANLISPFAESQFESENENRLSEDAIQAMQQVAPPSTDEKHHMRQFFLTRKVDLTALMAKVWHQCKLWSVVTKKQTARIALSDVTSQQEVAFASVIVPNLQMGRLGAGCHIDQVARRETINSLNFHVC